MSGKKQDMIFFIIITLFVYIISILYLTIPDFDFLNYQAYNCYSLLNDRFSHDFLVSNTRSCYNPLIYLPEYLLMFKLNNHPYIFILISQLDTIIALFLVYKILKKAFSVKKSKNNKNSSITGFNIFLCFFHSSYAKCL